MNSTVVYNGPWIYKEPSGKVVWNNTTDVRNEVMDRIKELTDKMNAVEAKLEEKTDCKRDIVLNVFRFEGSESLNAL